jgi:uncharacterized protein
VNRAVIWAGTDEWRAEYAAVELEANGIRATGTQLGIEGGAPYRVDYRLDAGDGFATRRLEVEARGEGWSRRLDLARRGPNGWTAEVAADGGGPDTEPGGATEGLAEALDCDLGRSPLTNLMPVARTRLAEREGSEDFVMAWVSVPDLALIVYPQRYEHVRRHADGGATVRFVDRGPGAGFVAELELDADGLVIDYPGLARRV